jgi:C-terminal processing protease CtpA/Prc
MLRIYALLFVMCLGIGFNAFSAQLTVEEKTLDFQQLIGRMKSSYGPLLYKKDKLGIDIDQLQTQYLRLIQESKTNSDFYYLINKFVAEFKDSHFAAQIPTDKKSVLPFFVELVQDKVLIEKVNPDLLDASKFPFKKGDQIIAIDGVPVDQILNSLMPFIGEGFEKTQKHYAAWVLTSRRAARFPTAIGQVILTVKTLEKAETLTQSFDWIIKGEDSPETLTQTLEKISQFTRGSFLRKATIQENVLGLIGTTDQQGHQKIEREFICSGTSRIQKPENATVISETPFVSYYWPTEKGNVGYLRIPHYFPEGDDEQKAIATYFAQYEKAISILEKNTVGLVIDQDHNCGGYVDLVDSMVGLFMDKPYRPMYFKMVANKENYLEYKKYADEADKLSISYDQILSVVNILKDSWIKGERMTPFVTLNGNEWNYPNQVRYTKPAVMLIDEMSGSGGDGFPSLMQGYGRVKLIGTRTMGAGGHVTENAPLNYSQIMVSMTRSQFFRPDGVPVENNGATPDYPYEITVDDFVNGYKGYRTFYTQKLLDLIK